MKSAYVVVAVLGLATAGCAPGERDAADAGGAAEEAAVQADAGAAEAAQVDTVAPPAATQTAAERERPTLRNWVLLEFKRPVEQADLDWLEANGFRVDTVMARFQVRGWLERPEGSEVIARDPRIARISAQAR
jgi:hypothetical protein